MTGLSFRAAGSRIGCTHRAIGEAVRGGRIPIQADGTVLPADVDAWHAKRRARRGGAHRGKEPPQETAKVPAGEQRRPQPPKPRQSVPAPTSAPPAAEGDRPPAIDLEALAKALAAGGTFATRAEAELARDSFVAQLRRLEYEEKAGRLLRREEVRHAVTSAAIELRTRLLAFPTQHATSIARLRTPAEVEHALRLIVIDALEGLADHFGQLTGDGASAGQGSGDSARAGSSPARG